jgi:hypothetical protein
MTAVAAQPSWRNLKRVTNRPMMSSRTASSFMMTMMGTAMLQLNYSGRRRTHRGDHARIGGVENNNRRASKHDIYCNITI